MRCKRERAHSSFFLLLRLKKTALLSKLYRKKKTYLIKSIVFCFVSLLRFVGWLFVPSSGERREGEKKSFGDLLEEVASFQLLPCFFFSTRIVRKEKYRSSSRILLFFLRAVMEKRAAFCELRENEEKERENRQSGSDPGSRGGGGEIFLLDSPAGSSLSLTKKQRKKKKLPRIRLLLARFACSSLPCFPLLSPAAERAGPSVVLLISSKRTQRRTSGPAGKRAKRKETKRWRRRFPSTIFPAASLRRRRASSCSTCWRSPRWRPACPR